MAWSKRAPERIYAVVMWFVSAALATFLIGLGGLIIGDLPRVENPVTLDQFVNANALESLNNEIEARQQRIRELRGDQRAGEDALKTESGNYQAAYEQFQNWLATRRATTDPDQDPELIARTNNLDVLRGRERQAERVVEEIAAEVTRLETDFEQLTRQRAELRNAAYPALERAQSNQQLRIFLFRLALTLPLLIVAFWLVAKKRDSQYWPLMRGFVLFAAFAFFVELVPYLPSYGGYVRYGVGIILTIFAGYYVIRGMRRYLENRRDAERQSEETRRKSVAYEIALKKIAGDVCPGCDRKILTTDETAADYCVHCGMHLYDRCGSCDARKLSFYKYCMRCGAASATGPTPAGPTAAATS